MTARRWFLLFLVATVAFATGASVYARTQQKKPAQAQRQPAKQVNDRKSDLESGQPADVARMPAGVPQKIAQVPELVQIAKLGRSGGIAVRGGGKPGRLSAEQLAEVSQAKASYAQLRKDATAEGITPEPYLYSAVQDHLLYEDVKTVTDELVKRQPGNAEVKELAAYVKSRSQ